MKSQGVAATSVMLFLVGLTAACGPALAAQGSATPIPIVADLGGVKAEGRLEPLRYVELAPVVTGLVSEVSVAEGEIVKAGDLLVSLDSTSGQTLETARDTAAVELGSAYEALRVATRQLDQYPLPRVFEGLTAEEAARAWLRELDAARVAFEPYKGTSRKQLKPSHVLSAWVYPSLPQRVIVDTRDYDEMAMVYKKRLDVARTNYTKAVDWLKLDAAVSMAQARVNDAQRRFDSLRTDSALAVAAGTRSALASAEMRAPFAGTVTRMDLKVGEVAAAGAPVITIADVSGWIVKTTDLTEIDVTSIREGTPATVIFDAMPGHQLAGHVTSIDLTYTDRQGDVLYPVAVLLGESPAWLRWGMTAEVTFGE